MFSFFSAFSNAILTVGSRKMKGIKYYCHRGYVLPETHVRFMHMTKREEEYGLILPANGISLEVVPTTVLVKSHGRTRFTSSRILQTSAPSTMDDGLNACDENFSGRPTQTEQAGRSEE
jgi:hypothetical protein